MLTTARPVPFNRRMNGQSAFMKISVGFTTQQRGGLGPLERDRLRRELAEHDVQRGDDRERDRRRRWCARSWSAIMLGRNCNEGSITEASAGSPIHPRPMLAIVMPSWVAAM